MKCIVAGCRTIPPPEADKLIGEAFSACPFRDSIDSIIHGGASGIDVAAGVYFAGMLPVEVYQAEWEKHGKSAGPIRNRKMAENADCLIAIWDGKSRGTANMIRVANELGLQVFVYEAIL